MPKNEYLKAPSKNEEWLSTSRDFENICDLPLLSIENIFVSGHCTENELFY